jgi:hypothetical protein
VEIEDFVIDLVVGDGIVGCQVPIKESSEKRPVCSNVRSQWI